MINNTTKTPNKERINFELPLFGVSKFVCGKLPNCGSLFSSILIEILAHRRRKRGRRGNSFPPPPFLPAPSEQTVLGNFCEIALAIFQKMVSSRTVKIHQNMTFCNLTDHFGGGAERRPSISPRQILSPPPAARGRPSRLAKTRFASRAILILSRICFAQ